MCYDAATLTKKAAAYARRYGDQEMWEAAKKESPAFYHLNGFDEPDLPVITAEKPDAVQFFQWGFVPMAYAPSIHGRPMNTLNARNDKIFTEKSIFRTSAESQRCLVLLDGFFDHHKKNGIAYPHYIQLKSKEPFLVGGLWQTYVDKRDEVAIHTVTLVTGPANKEMAWVHNEPAYSPDSRMIYIVDPKDDDTWLNGAMEQAQSIIKPLPDNRLDYHPCQPLRNNKKLHRVYRGNLSKIQEYHYYPQLEEQQGSLF